MSDMKDDQNNNENGRKQFYSLNLTPERIFMIFVLFVIIIAVIIIIIAFSFNKKSVTTEEVTGTEYEFLNDITGTEYDYHELLADSEEGNIVDVLPESEVIDSTVQTEIDPNTPKTIVIEDKPEIKIASDKVVYSSDLLEKEPKTVKVESKPVKNTSVDTKEVTKKTPIAVKKEPEQAVAKKQPVNKVQVEKYIIQVGSYSNQKAADEVLNYYKNAGYLAYTKSFQKDGKTYYRLRVGPYDDKKKAESILGKVKVSKYGKDSFISVGYF